jgi:hypothetical protein
LEKILQFLRKTDLDPVEKVKRLRQGAFLKLTTWKMEKAEKINI